MLKFFYNNMLFQQIDPRIYELEKDIEFYKIILFGTFLVLLILVLIIILQRLSISRMKKAGQDVSAGGKAEDELSAENSAAADDNQPKPAVSEMKVLVRPKELPDPGLIFKYSLAKEHITEKLITIGQTEGNIKTYSTEVINDHLSLFIRIIDNRRDRDIYDLPDRIYEEYQVDLRRDGKVLIFYPGLEGYRQMGSREKIYVKNEPDVAGDPTFASLQARQPVRFRIGDRLNQDDKFVNGFFEFHLFTQEYEVKTAAGIPKVEKNFLVRLYKIYPGYDVSSPNEDGLYPMIDPFTAG